MSRKEHWEEVYATKTPDQVSWTQAIPQTSLDLIHAFGDDKSVSIIDVGGGDSHLVDCLLDEGYSNLTVLDISGNALERAKERLGDRASLVNWVETDITTFQPEQHFDIWHDRAVFHFLTESEDIAHYVSIAENHVSKGMVIGTFSEDGPLRCSALDVTQYSSSSLSQLFQARFDALTCLNEDHTTPFNTTQNFTFCSFRKKTSN
jgi:predicted TPR repeat methyltransferase